MKENAGNVIDTKKLSVLRAGGPNSKSSMLASLGDHTYGTCQSDSGSDDSSSSDEEKVEEQDLPFLMFQATLSESSHSDTLGSVKRIDEFSFGMQEMFMQIETDFINNIVMSFYSRLLDILNLQEDEKLATEEAFDSSKLMKRREYCETVDATGGVKIDERSVGNKISFGIIHIATIKVGLTISLEPKKFSFDITNPTSGYGLMSLLYPILQNLASIDSSIMLPELGISEGHYSETALWSLIIARYRSHLVLQVLKLLGSSNMLGNPAKLLTNVGQSVIELGREPIEGMRQGPEEFLQGVGSGVQGVVRGVVGGSFDSVATISGSLYSILK